MFGKKLFPLPEAQPPTPLSLSRLIIWSLVIAVLVVGLAAPFLDAPLQRDQGVYAACGGILLHGGAPYRDCWDTKGPLTHYTYALAQAVFGVNLRGPVILSSLMAALTSIALWRVARQWFGEAIAWSAGLIYGWLVVAIPFDMNAQSEGFANLFLALGAWGILSGHERDSRWRLAGAGAALAIAALYKYTIAAVAAAVVVGCLLYLIASRRSTLHLPRSALYTLSGGLITLFAFAIYLATQNALGYAMEHVIFMLTEFPKVAVNPTLLLFPGESGPPLFYWQRTLGQLARLPVFYVLAGPGCVLAIWRRRAWSWLITVWLAAALMSVYPQKVMTLYHWTLAIPALALGVSAFAWEVRARRPALVVVAVAVLANIGCRVYADQWLVSGPYLTGQQTQAEFFASQAVQDEIEVAEYIRDRTDSGDLIWVWGNHSIIYYWADRPSPTRFIFNSPLMAAIGENEFQPRWKEEVLAALYERPPTYIVVTWYDRTWFDYQNPVDQFAAMPDYQKFLDRYYRRETFISRFAIHRLNPWWSRLNAPDLLDAVTTVDLLAELRRADLQPAPNQPIETRDFKLHDEPAYPALLMHPEGRATFNVTLPQGIVCFRSDLALDPQSWGWGGDGASFALLVNGETVFEQTVGNTEADRFWQPVIVNLSAWAGQSVTLTLATGPGPNSDFTGDLAGWGMPRIVVSPDQSAPSCETNIVQKLAP
jgi:hypothetical protein